MPKPDSGPTTLSAKGKQGQPVSFATISAELGLTGEAAGLFADTDMFASYSYGLKGRASDQNITGTNDNEYLTTGDGNDTINMRGGDDIVVAGAGDDRINVGTGNNIVDGGDGTDTYVMSYDYGNNVDLTAGTMTDSDGNVIDVLISIENVAANNLDNIITGDDNDNYIVTGAGNDTVYGGGGNDNIEASGTAGVKMLYGEGGDDIINGGNVGDTIVGGEGADTITGGDGDDTIDLSETVAATDRVIWYSGDGTDVIEFFDSSADADAGGDLLLFDFSGDLSASTVQQLVDGGYLRFSDDGNGGTLIEVDVNGGGDSYEQAFVIDGTGYVDNATSIALFEGNITDTDFLFA